MAAMLAMKACVPPPGMLLLLLPLLLLLLMLLVVVVCAEAVPVSKLLLSALSLVAALDSIFSSSA